MSTLVDDSLETLPEESFESYDDPHPSLTPPTAAEQLFMGTVDSTNISAAYLAHQIHISSAAKSYGTTATDDFETAAGSTTSGFASPLLVYSNDSSDESDNDSYSAYHKDVLSRNYETTTMSSTTNKKIFPTEAPQHVDAAEKVYDTAKGIWAWGKGINVVKNVLELTEGGAKNIVGMTGNTLEGLDGGITDQLHGIDDNILNPAIAVVVSHLLNFAGKAEDVVGPVVVQVLKPLGLIKESAENPPPEVTSTAHA